tara:strand:- start:467 stop:580 length:114 start_codon:yes stop_codon:yes gene_type:complete
MCGFTFAPETKKRSLLWQEALEPLSLCAAKRNSRTIV